MTKKDYIRAGDVIRASSPPNHAERDRIIEAFVRFFEGDNARFLPDHFRAYARGEGPAHPRRNRQ
jgi:hypothetical protein